MGKIYFVSDIHLGLQPAAGSRQREIRFVQWLDTIKNDAEVLYLLGDIFDYWFEYRKVVPRGFVRTLGKLAELSDQGIEIHFFTGNHDVWVFDYLTSEIGLTVHKKPLITEVKGKRFFIAHGDGLGPGDLGYKILKYIFHSRTLQWLYAWIHPDVSTTFAHWWSKKSRYSKGIAEAFQGEDKEEQVIFARKMLEKEHFDYFVFGHRHVVMDINLNGYSRLINTGEWIFGSTYAVFDGENIILKEYNTFS